MDQTLRKLQLCELDILKAIKKVCNENDIRFFLASGTLLGAVRHQGFIPWDDDIDIEMPYDDYLRFQEIAQKELGEGYFVQSTETDPYYHFPYLRVQKRNTTLVREWEKNLPGNHRIWVDVFPLVSLGGQTDYRLKRLIIRIATFLRMDAVCFKANEKWYREQTNSLQFYLVKAARMLPKFLCWKMERSLLRYFVFGNSNADTPDVTFVWTTVTRRLPRRIYDEPDVQLRFEDDDYPVPNGYDEYLKILYDDYMELPPEEERKPVFDLFVNFEQDWTSVSKNIGKKTDIELSIIHGMNSDV